MEQVVRKYFETVGVVMKYISIGIIMLISFIDIGGHYESGDPGSEEESRAEYPGKTDRSLIFVQGGNPEHGRDRDHHCRIPYYDRRSSYGKDRWPWMCHHTPGICRLRTNRFL